MKSGLESRSFCSRLRGPGRVSCGTASECSFTRQDVDVESAA